jgi:hypothetical protein
MRGGGLYKAEWGERQRGQGVFADQIKNMFAVACRKTGMNERKYDLSTEHFRRVVGVGGQFDLFGETTAASVDAVDIVDKQGCGD